MLFSPGYITNNTMAKIKVEYAGISEYEKFRLENIKRNEEVRSCTRSFTENGEILGFDFCFKGKIQNTVTKCTKELRRLGLLVNEITRPATGKQRLAMKLPFLNWLGFPLFSNVDQWYETAPVKLLCGEELVPKVCGDEVVKKHLERRTICALKYQSSPRFVSENSVVRSIGRKANPGLHWRGQIWCDWRFRSPT